MKDGKPEVLIIGETHPVLLYSINLPPKHSTINFGKISKDIVVPDIFVGDAEKLIEAVRVPSTILKAEISWIKDFGAQRILYEFVDNTQTRKICKKLGKTKNSFDLYFPIKKHLYFSALTPCSSLIFTAGCK